jgi:hypothetical protein
MGIFKQSVILSVFLGGIILAGQLHVDQFQLFQQNYVIHYEHQVDIRESLIGGVIFMDTKSNGTNYDLRLFDLSYRRYVVAQDNGPFYSFGFRFGPANVSDESDEENEYLAMPFYDIGLKSKLSPKWFHMMKLEVGYLMLYTDTVNVDRALGLQITPSFGFAYQFN